MWSEFTSNLTFDINTNPFTLVSNGIDKTWWRQFIDLNVNDKPKTAIFIGCYNENDNDDLQNDGIFYIRSVTVLAKNIWTDYRYDDNGLTSDYDYFLSMISLNNSLSFNRGAWGNTDNRMIYQFTDTTKQDNWDNWYNNQYSYLSDAGNIWNTQLNSGLALFDKLYVAVIDTPQQFINWWNEATLAGDQNGYKLETKLVDDLNNAFKINQAGTLLQNNVRLDMSNIDKTFSSQLEFKLEMEINGQTYTNNLSSISYPIFQFCNLTP